MKKLIKKLIKTKAFIFIVSRVIALVLRLIFITIRWDISPKEFKNKFENENIAFFFWHGRMLMMPFFAPKKDIYVLISNHNDGEMIAQTMHALNLKTVRGSSSRGGTSAAIKILRDLSQDSIAITPDGPRGPCYSIKANSLDLVKKSGKKIVFMVYSTDKKKVFRSWDKMILPHPFSKGKFRYLEVLLDENSDIAVMKEELEKNFLRLTHEVDRD